jgi:tRNA(fMet)-specific endonuclease VapC
MVYLSFITLAELRSGFLYGGKAVENERHLHLFLAKKSVGVLYADDQTPHHFSRIYKQLRQQGTPIPSNDLWTASLVVQHNIPLYSRDAHFDHLPQLPRIH